jgi:hypothetical protein
VFSDRGPNAALMFGAWRVAAPGDVDGVVLVADDAGDGADPPGSGAEVIARSRDGNDGYVVLLTPP